MKRVLILGNNGMLGHACEYVFNANTSVEVSTSSRSGHDSDYRFDALSDKIEDLISVAKPDFIVNCIGMIKPRIDENSMTSIHDGVVVNALFPQLLSDATKNSSTKIIQIATDCVYSGSIGSYDELAPHDPEDVYGKTKSLGEVSAENFLNLRVSIIGPEKNRSTSLLEWFLNQTSGTSLRGYANHFWNGVSTYHFARVALGLLEGDNFISGKFHLVPSNRVSKFELLQLFQKQYGRQDLKLEEFYPEGVIDRTLSTIHQKQNESMWQDAGYQQIPTVEDMVREMKELSEHFR
jgi:dTDP-4-dehydrorhamnose reductase